MADLDGAIRRAEALERARIEKERRLKEDGHKKTVEFSPKDTYSRFLSVK
jgi:hypothetical protein